MSKKWIYPALILFVVFFALSNPEAAGPQARNFFGWIGDQASAAGTFLDGLFGDDEAPVTDPGGSGSSPAEGGTGQDSFNTLSPLDPAPAPTSSGEPPAGTIATGATTSAAGVT